MPARGLRTRRRFALCAGAALLLGLASPRAQAQPAAPAPLLAGEFPAVPWASPNDFGQTGLMQMPDARFQPDGTLSFGLTHVHPYNRLFFTVQALPFLEATFRYTEIGNRLYGPVELSGDQTYKDRGIDLKLRLLEEGPWWPQIAIGLRDLGGTSHFGAEYLVASRRVWDLDFTLGIGWGNMATRGALANPLGRLSPRFAVRPRPDSAGSLRAGFFRGPHAGLFGGVTWASPIPGLALKLEYDANDYQEESKGNRFRVASPVNAGLVWRAAGPFELALGIERGNTVMARASMVLGLNDSPALPRSAAPPTLPERRPTAGARSGGTRALADRLAPALAEQGILLRGLALEAARAEARIANTRFAAMAQAVGRAARILAATLPAGVEEIVLAIEEQGLVVNRVALMRADIERAAAHRGSAEEAWARARFGAEVPPLDAPLLDTADRPRLRWGVAPAWRQSVGGPEGFYLWQLWLRGHAELELAPGLYLAGGAGQDIANSFDRLRIPSDSRLPRVRSDVKEYLRQGRTSITNLQLDWFGRLGEEVYARATMGWLEPMFAGAGGEVLWKPEGATWALGLGLHHVRQRDFDGGLGLRRYGVTTGHLTWYQTLPFFGLETALSGGRYLAGDWGGTLEVSRRFASGIRVGAWATLTNVSARDFGEGAFDKGFFISIPLDLFFVGGTRETADFAFRPLSRDGGQRLGERRSLYGIASAADRGALARDWRRLMD